MPRAFVLLLMLPACSDDAKKPDGGDSDVDTDTDTGTGTDTGSDTGSQTDTTPEVCADCPEGGWCEDQPDGSMECVDDCASDVCDPRCPAVDGVARGRPCDGHVCCPMGSECVDGGCPLPDLTIDAAYLAESVREEVESFDPDDCEILEGCIAEPGARNLLRFSLRTPNVGEGNLHLGMPNDNPLFEFSECHRHFHFSGYAQYQLLDSKGALVGTGHKQAFCLLDFDPLSADAPPSLYDCSYQGIQAGWSDIYDAALPCQWIDVTDVPAGHYTLRAHVNFEGLIAETDYENDMVEIPVTVGSTCPSGCRILDPACCLAGDPCGQAGDGACDCGGGQAWDAADCDICECPAG